MEMKEMSKKTTDIVAYLTPVGLILAFLLGDRQASRFHLNQALVLWLAGVLVSIVVRICDFLPLIGTLVGIIGGLISLVLFVFWIIGFVSAISGTEKKVPVLGEITLL